MSAKLPVTIAGSRVGTVFRLATVEGKPIKDETVRVKPDGEAARGSSPCR